MSETDLARSWCGLADGGGTPLPRGGEALSPPLEAKEKGARAPVTVLSARDLSCSDQLNPWSVRAAGEVMSEPALNWFAVLA
jgi:hypothetical protein